MVGWHHPCGQAPGDCEGQRGGGMLQSMGSLRVRHDWVTEQQRRGYWYNSTFIT